MNKLDGVEILKVEIAVPVNYILKLAGDNPDDVLSNISTFGWKFEYLGKTFGDYIAIENDIKDGKICPPPLEELQEIKEVLKEQARNTLLYRALLIDSLNEFFKSEIDDRLRDKYYPVVMETRKTYVTLDQNGKRVYHKKFSLKYFLMVIKYTFVKLISDMLFKLL